MAKRAIDVGPRLRAPFAQRATARESARRAWYRLAHSSTRAAAERRRPSRAVIPARCGSRRMVTDCDLGYIRHRAPQRKRAHSCHEAQSRSLPGHARGAHRVGDKWSASSSGTLGGGPRRSTIASIDRRDLAAHAHAHLAGFERDGLVSAPCSRRSRPGWTTRSPAGAHAARAHPGAVRLGGRQSHDRPAAGIASTQPRRSASRKHVAASERPAPLRRREVRWLGRP